MKNLIYLILLLFFVSCQSEQTATAEVVTQNQTTVSKTKAIPVVARPAQQQVRDTSVQPRKSRGQYTVSKSRQKNEIAATYPYDIDLKAANEKTLTSDQVLDKNDKPTVLLFWLTTCFPCSMEMKAIKEKYADWQKEADFNFYAISTDFEKNFPKFIQKVEENQWPWKTYNDVNREFRQVLPGGLNGLPQTFILDKNGEIAYHKRKYRPGDEDVLFAKVKELANK